MATDRGLYSRNYAYADSPQSIGTHTHTHTHKDVMMVKSIFLLLLYHQYIVLIYLDACTSHRIQCNNKCPTHGEWPNITTIGLDRLD